MPNSRTPAKSSVLPLVPLRPTLPLLLTLTMLLVLVAGGLLLASHSATAAALAPPPPSPHSLATAVPSPDHVIVVMEENHAFSEIIGNAQAPYINALASQGALFTDSHAIEHPSQPNYLDIFSGSNQGVTDDSCPHTFTGIPNLGGELLTASLTFSGYSEGLPGPGSTVCTSGEYARKHSPWVNFTDVPPAGNLPFTSFPTDFTTLPTVGFVTPNLLDDMHDGSIAAGDTWLQQNIDAYKQWVNAHNSLLIVTWDEDDSSQANQVATIFYGPMVVSGQYSEAINHFNVLRTLEDMYGLPHAGQSGQVQPITDVWIGAATPTTTPTVVATHTSTTTPTRTATHVATSTATAIPPTATNSSTPAATSTQSQPTSTGSAVATAPPGTDTPTSVSTSTQAPVNTATGTVATATATAGIATATPTACTLIFRDVPPSSTFYSFVRCLACLGIIGGYPDGTFRPNNNVTRGQLSKIISNAAGFNDPAGAQLFEDVPPGSTFYDYAYRLASRNIIAGYPCGGPGEPCGPSYLPYFRPGNNATRGQISKIVANAANLNNPPGNQLFQDVAPGSTFYDFVQRLANHGAMSGYPCGGPGEPCGPNNLPYFRPGNNATRGQTSKITASIFFPDCNPPFGE